MTKNAESEIRVLVREATSVNRSGNQCVRPWLILTVKGRSLEKDAENESTRDFGWKIQRQLHLMALKGLGIFGGYIRGVIN